MSTLAGSLNLRPQEKRIIAVIAVVFFVVLNLILVFPHFKDYSNIQGQLKKTESDIQADRRIIEFDNAPGGLKQHLSELQSGKGGSISSKEIQLQQTITDRARARGVFIQTISGVSTTPVVPGSLSDKFFESQSIRIDVLAAEDNLVKFLWDVGNDPAMIRVRELQLHPTDNNRYKLNAIITLTADYQKTAPVQKPTPILVETPKTPAKAATPPPSAARTTPTNANPAPAPGRAGAPPLPTPPTPGRTNSAIRNPQSAIPSPTPPTPGRTNLPPVPPRPPRNQI
jgi:hypothetical protein